MPHVAQKIIPEEAWWRLRTHFQKDMPRPAWNEEWVMNMGIRQSKASASNLVRPFKRFGLFTEDGKPTPRMWDWVEDAKYPDVCKQLLQEIYPEDAVHAFTSTDDDVRERLVRWFQRTQGVALKAARDYAAFYMLLLEGDPSKQDGTAASKGPRTPKPSVPRPAVRSRPIAGKSKAESAGAQETRSADVRSEQNGHDVKESTMSRPGAWCAS